MLLACEKAGVANPMLTATTGNLVFRALIDDKLFVSSENHAQGLWCKEATFGSTLPLLPPARTELGLIGYSPRRYGLSDPAGGATPYAEPHA